MTRDRRPESLVEARGSVAAVIRRALAQSLRLDIDAVPEELVLAIAEGRGDRERLTELLDSLGAEGSPRLELVRIDTDQISAFVFESSRPPVIRGASEILRSLNQWIEKQLGEHTLFSGGGEALLVVPAGQGEAICRQVEAEFREKSAGALRVTAVALVVRPVDFLSQGGEPKPVHGARLVSGTQAVLTRLHDRVRRAKAERTPERAAVPGGAKRCASCRDRASAGIKIDKYREKEPGELCKPCDTRWWIGRRLIRGINLEEMVKGFAAEVGAESEKGSKALDVGFLYADGNGMGDLFGRLQNLAELRFLSLAVYEIFAGLRKRADELVNQRMRTSAEEGSPFVSLVAGGDEVIWILPAAVALEVASVLPAWLEGESAAFPDLKPLLERAELSRLTLGMGLVLCAHSYPVRYQFELAKALQKNAKRLFYRGGRHEAESTIDFEVLTDASPLSEKLEAARAVAYETEEDGFLRTCRPYYARDFARLDLLRAEGGRIAEEKAPARSQFYRLQDGATEGRAVFLNLLRYQIGRGGKAAERYRAWLAARGVNLEVEGALEGYFIRPAAGRAEGPPEGTWIGDALELAPYFRQLEPLRTGR